MNEENQIQNKGALEIKKEGRNKKNIKTWLHNYNYAKSVILI